MMKRNWILVLCSALLPLMSCALATSRQSITPNPTSQPAEGDANAMQVGGQVALGVQTDAKITGVGGSLTGFVSQFGPGAVIVVMTAMFTQQGFMALVVILLIYLSHKREVIRLRKKD